MTNITLSIEENTYNKMKKFSEIKWSEFIRKQIDKRVIELESLEKSSEKLSGTKTYLASEDSLKKNWMVKEEDKAWEHLQDD